MNRFTVGSQWETTSSRTSPISNFLIAPGTIPYDRLVLATRGKPIPLPIEGVGLNNVFHLWQPEDAIAMREVVTAGDPKTAGIIGGEKKAGIERKRDKRQLHHAKPIA